ncbi:hypothetical protein [Devosia salina]|uniref:Uncharacterized protein n=1 Tax=Devosia salina TaxID=2860336 RepID=A0ABX8WG07_9HYPH|nr:hypothetical protein [Devosia salina]QYO75667.1 hypothetical protein K1X15_13620 [Devosia salina]
MDLHDNAVVAELARQQSIETGNKVYAVDPSGMDAVYIDGQMLRWAYIDDVEIVYGDADAEKWEAFFHGTRH